MLSGEEEEKSSWLALRLRSPQWIKTPWPPPPPQVQSLPMPSFLPCSTPAELISQGLNDPPAAEPSGAFLSEVFEKAFSIFQSNYLDAL